MDKPVNPPIYSFVKRTSRLSLAQKRALNELTSAYQPKTPIISGDRPLYLEIGFGDGKALVQMAQNQPEVDFLGIEVHDPGVGQALNALNKKAIGNVGIVHTDAMGFMAEHIKDSAVDKLMLFFPDPWHKKKHHKRRIIRPAFIEQITRILKPKGLFHMATDWHAYAKAALEQVNKYPILTNLSTSDDFILRPKERPQTKFEARGKRLGHGVWDMMWQKTP